ncbi:HEAT repeat-containing protein 6 isoform X2 [Colletes gigas]|uniref:HEAT repeat-containing protein 6 isoform X2 n=1 Tax=Colletes gigas TaxID=935657 RepID=UPI001C9A442E|nr:HEAT repeat-containing protein 6 isoform X2 [Colletes gigas]
MALTYTNYPNNTAEFNFITEKLLILTQIKSNDTKLINNYLCELNKLDFRYVTILNNDELQLLIKQLCMIIVPLQTVLIQNTCKLLVSLIQNNVRLQGETLKCSQQWILEVLESAALIAHNDILCALKAILINEHFDDINNYLQLLLGKERLLKKYLTPSDSKWSEVQYQAVGCLEGILINKHSDTPIAQEFICIIKDIVLDIVSSFLYLNGNKLYCSKILSSCLHILHIITANKLLPHSTDSMGEILGVVQAFSFYGIKKYPHAKPQLLRPAAMNLPETIHVIPRCKNLKNHKAKSKKLVKKPVGDVKNNIVTECKGVGTHSSDSDTSDTESNNSDYLDSKVRLEAVCLLQAIVENSQSREIFGFWPQIVATGSRSDARVLTRSILKEPVSKVKQTMLSTLTELLVDAKSFLIHAEDAHHTSFITFFGTVCLMIKELHFTVSLVLNSDKNVAVLTHALKCAAALIQGTPYSRLKTGLATKLMKNCGPYIFHKDPTVRVAALSAFEAVASHDPVTPEIFDILAKQSTLNIESEHPYLNTSHSDNTEEEVDVEDLESNIIDEYENKLLKDTNICFLIHVCLENIANKTMNTPVRLQSLKLIGRMAFATGSLVFSHVELVTTTLTAVIQDSETQVILHACRTLEIMAGCLINTDSENDNASVFWNIIFEPITLLLQHPQTILREAACDCLGSISPVVLNQLSRQKTVLIITVLFGAVHDEESAVRAAGLRALGMLVTLPPLKEETGFLMDLADIVCLTADDRNLGVRVKGTWALANLCDCLSKDKNNEEMEPLPLEVLLPKLYQVRWNACRAIGLVLSNNPDDILPSSWRDQVFPVLCNLICDSPNFKVRTNAAWALYACNSYGKYTATLWKSIILAFENSQYVPSYIEYPHRDALVQQLCLTLSHLAACTEVSDLQNLWIEVGDHVDDISNYMKQFQEIIVPEKIGDLIKAKSQLQKYVKSAPLLEERKIAQTLASIFERTK